MAVYIGHDECQVIYVARNGRQRRVSSVWVGDQQVFPAANRQEIHLFTRDTQGYGREEEPDSYVFTVPVPWWAASMDVVLIGAGEKGRDGTKSFSGGSDGAGGKSGAWVVSTHAMTTSGVASIVVGKGTSTTPFDTYVYIPGEGNDSIVVADSQGTRTPNSGSTGGSVTPRTRTEYNQIHTGGDGATRNNPGNHPGGGGGGGQGSNLVGNPTTGRDGGDGYVWLRFRSAPALDPGDEVFILRVGVASGVAYDALRNWAVGIGKTHQTITEITAPMEVSGPSLQSLFHYCRALTSVPDLDTSQVTNMYAMFYNCHALTSVPDLDTSQVTDMRFMFYECRALTTIPALNTSQVTNMYAMFYNCHALTSVPDLDTSQVTDMRFMFNGCHALTSVPDLDTSQVTNMQYMFYECRALTSVPDLDTGHVTNMKSMFEDCWALTSVPDLDTGHVTTMQSMFDGCRALTTIPALDTSQVTTMRYMFYNCRALTTIPALDTSQVTDMYDMFYNCSSLESVTLPGMGNGFTNNQLLDMTATKLNAAAANALMQSLGTPPPGGYLNLPATARGADTSIATAKNWTVTIG